MEAFMPTNMVDDINNYLDEYREDKNKKSLAGTLIGQISQGEQLLLDSAEPRLKQYSEFICSLGSDYINFFFDYTGLKLTKPKRVEIDATWSVHSYAGSWHSNNYGNIYNCVD
jgi:hypothetical protein